MVLKIKEKFSTLSTLVKFGSKGSNLCYRPNIVRVRGASVSTRRQGQPGHEPIAQIQRVLRIFF